MGMGGLMLAMLLPWLAGVLWLRRLLPRGQTNWPLWLGYGYFAGMLGTTLLMRALDAVGVPLGLGSIAAALVLLSAGAVWVSRGQWREVSLPGADWRQPLGTRLLWLALLALTTVRLAGLGLEIAWQPLFPWDAWSHWATKARVWFELGQLVPFVPAQEWLSQSTLLAYTDRASHYPPAVPLLQTWMAFGLGRWDDTLINLPWLGAGIALLLGFYGQARHWGMAPLYALAATYFLASIPMLDTHIALAGDADLFLAAVYGLAAVALFQWMRTRERAQAALAALFGLACLLVKQPGIGWALTLLPAVWITLSPRAGIIGSLLALGLGFGAMLAAGQTGFNVLGYTLQFHYVPVWGALWDNLFVRDNWHLLFYLLPLAVVLNLHRLPDTPWRGMTAVVLAGFTFLFVVFFFTHVSAWVEDYTVVNRALLHMVPMLLFYIAVLLHDLPGRAAPLPEMQEEREVSK